MATPTLSPVPPEGFATGLPATVGDAPTPDTPAARFNGHGARLVPPPPPYFAQPASGHQPSVPVPEHTARRTLPTGHVRSVDPEITTRGAPMDPQSATDTDEPGPMEEMLKNLGDRALVKKGDDQLEAAREAYTTYGRIKLASDAKQAIQPFIACASLNHSNALELFKELKKIKLPDGAPKDLAVTIKFPGKETVSLIPPGEALKTASTQDIKDWYRMAFQAMHMWGQENARDEHALTRAEARLNQVVAMLKAIRKEIDRRKLMDNLGPNMPAGSQLEARYHQFTERGVTCSYIARGDLLHQPFEAEGQVTDPTNSQPEETPPPAYGSPDDTSNSPATAGSMVPPAVPQGSSGTSAAASGSSTEMQ